MRGLLRIARSGRVDPTPMTTHRFGFDGLEEAFRLTRTTEEGIVKPLITLGWDAGGGDGEVPGAPGSSGR